MCLFDVATFCKVGTHEGDLLVLLGWSTWADQTWMKVLATLTPVQLFAFSQSIQHIRLCKNRFKGTGFENMFDEDSFYHLFNRPLSEWLTMNRSMSQIKYIYLDTQMGDSYIEKMHPKSSFYLIKLHNRGADIAVHFVQFFFNSMILLGFEPRTHL